MMHCANLKEKYDHGFGLNKLVRDFFFTCEEIFTIFLIHYVDNIWQGEYNNKCKLALHKSEC